MTRDRELRAAIGKRAPQPAPAPTADWSPRVKCVECGKRQHVGHQCVTNRLKRCGCPVVQQTYSIDASGVFRGAMPCRHSVNA